MKTALLPWFLQVIAVTFVYELKCPAPGHWRLRARKFYCGQNYVCLLRSPENSYRETCDGLDYSSTGSKLIFEPYYNKAGCSYKRYQPFPFSTDGNNNSNLCPYIGTAVRNMSCQEIIVRPSQQTNLSSPLENRFKDVRNDYNEGRTHRLNCIYFTAVLLIVLSIVLPLYALSEWPDAFYKVLSFEWIVDHLKFIKMLKEEEIAKIKIRKLMEILLDGGEDHYDQFLEALNAFKEYKDLAKLIQNTEVTPNDQAIFKNCTERSN
ncbi:unnamed protein product [Mytilus coruscus]|uniref:CARD domain-containing protein n=1 Tax=Mytilus coruscus TaxID=42192 RepID=A0A6J8E6X5_MYTCO|nr:unnamed protein product [Mytilus coruscus]